TPDLHSFPTRRSSDLGSPMSGIPADNFTVRWTGQVQPQYSETYAFWTTTDDGVRLWVNNTLIIDKWLDQGATEYGATINLTGGRSEEHTSELQSLAYL